ncbi:MAG: hypothetical protein QXY99_00285 [Thermoproteota archaeon]
MPVKWVEDTARSIVEQVEKSNSSVLVMPCVGGSLSTTGNMPGWEWVDSVKGAMRAGASGYSSSPMSVWTLHEHGLSSQTIFSHPSSLGSVVVSKHHTPLRLTRILLHISHTALSKPSGSQH